MSKSRSQYVCQQCGYTQSQWAGKCPNCESWNSLVETIEKTQKLQNSRTQGDAKVQRLSEIRIDETKRISTGDSELDGVLGGGLVPGEVVLVAGEPGIGKSTLLTQVALKINGPVLYVCGEESVSQVALRVKRLQDSRSKIKDSILLFESVDVDSIETEIEKQKPGLVVVDSVQTLVSQDLTGTAGSVGQVREAANRLSVICKRLAVPLFLVGHVTKEGNIAGPRVLEHMVDTVLWFEGERGQPLRLLRAVKNRFGPTDAVGVWEMEESGLKPVMDPSQLFLAERITGVPGSVVSVVMEGKRPLLVEIQALTVATNSPMPRRVSTGVDYARLQMLTAVLTKRASLHLDGVDIFVNVTGGIKLADRGIDLAICLAIASAFLNKSLEANVAAVGEIGLLGEVRKVQGLELRVKEAKKLGYRVASSESGKSIESAIKKLLE